MLIEVVGKGELLLRSKQQAIVARRLPKGRDLASELIEGRRKEAERD